jgi:hypothetical protein
MRLSDQRLTSIGTKRAVVNYYTRIASINGGLENSFRDLLCRHLSLEENMKNFILIIIVLGSCLDLQALDFLGLRKKKYSPCPGEELKELPHKENNTHPGPKPGDACVLGVAPLIEELKLGEEAARKVATNSFFYGSDLCKSLELLHECGYRHLVLDVSKQALAKNNTDPFYEHRDVCDLLRLLHRLDYNELAAHIAKKVAADIVSENDVCESLKVLHELGYHNLAHDVAQQGVARKSNNRNACQLLELIHEFGYDQVGKECAEPQ